MASQYRVGVVLGAILAAVVLPARAASIVGAFDWENAGDLQGWSSAESWVTLSNPGVGGAGDDGYLNVGFEEGAGSFALVKADAASLFAGNWQSGMWVEFDFWANDQQPGFVEVRGAGQSGEEWQNRVFDSSQSAMQTQTWTRLRAAQFETYSDWDYGGGTQQQFVEDLASIDWIGVYIWRNTSDAQDYGLDNFNLMVPEPGEWLLILASMGAVYLAVRKKKPQPCAVAAGRSGGTYVPSSRRR